MLIATVGPDVDQAQNLPNWPPPADITAAERRTTDPRRLPSRHA